MIVFNLFAVLESLVAAIPAFFFVILAVAFDAPFLMGVGFTVFFATSLLLDGFLRIPGEDADHGMLWGMLWPSSGGHVMFLPVWLIGLVGSGLFGLSSVSMLFAG